MIFRVLVVLGVLASLACSSRPTQTPKSAAPQPTAEAVVQKDSLPAKAADSASPTKAERECQEFCVAVMDNRGQITDECPKECKEDPESYTEADVPSDDEANGLVVRKHCMSECRGKTDAPSIADCQQICCTSNCTDKAEYSGGGYGNECPGMCREFLKRTAEK